MPTIIETTEGRMEVDFNKLEVYVQRADTFAPMTKIAEGRWLAECFWCGWNLIVVKNTVHVSITIEGQLSPIGSTLL